MRRGQASAALLDQLRPLVQEQMDKVDARVFARIRSGDPLTADIALQCWLEKYAFAQLLRTLEKDETAGRSAGKRVEPEMKA